MPQTIECVPHADCTGCGSCLNSCPKDAISMQLDGDFPYPVIDAGACVGCGLCERACPALHPRFDNAPEPDCYAYWAPDEVRAMSSSGGAFTMLAEEVISQGGVVAGAAYSEDCYSVSYRIAETQDDLAALRGSKYLQADAGHVYRQVRRALSEGRQALFVGCPCEVAGMRAFLGKDDPNLLLVDLVCHGTPPQALFERYVREQEARHGSKAVRVSFRDKSFVAWNHSLSIDFADGGEYRGRRSEDPYLRAFLDRLMFRESCGHCPFARLPRQGDLTIADFWDVDRYDESLDDRRGTSLLLVNNARGERMLEALRRGAKLLEPAPLEHAIKHNAQIKWSSLHNERRGRFQSLMHDYGYSFEKAAVYALEDRYDVGFVGWWYGANYGSALTAFALNRTLVGMGRSTLMLNWPMDPPPPEGRGSRGRQFGGKFYDVAEYLPLERCCELNTRCDTFVVGSDQLWNWYSNQDTGTYYFFLDWVDKWHRKVAYATSFGHDNVYYPEEMRFRLIYLLSRFDRVSVRERSAVEVCRHDFGVEAEQVVDPVFLCDRSCYDEAAALSEMDCDEPYVLGYVMNPTPDKRDAIRRTASELGLPYRILVDGQGDFEQLAAELDDENLMAGVAVEDWLKLLSHASYVVTDSFHGFCFSLIFGRQFSVFINPLRGRARVDTLAELAGVSSRVFDTFEQFERARNWDAPVDFSEVRRRMAPEVERSRAWLASALDEPRRQPSAVQMVCQRVVDLEGRVEELEGARGRLEELEGRVASLWGVRLRDIARRGVAAVRERGLPYALGRLAEKLGRRAARLFGR